MTHGSRSRPPTPLVRESLAAPSAVSVLAWLLPIPMVISDAVAAAVIWRGSSGLPLIVAPGLYLTTFVWFGMARVLAAAARSPARRAALALSAFALTGATWLGGALLVIGSVQPLEVPSAWGIIVGIIMQVFIGVLIAVVLFARETAGEAQASALVARAGLLEAIVRLRTVRTAAQQSLTAWISDVLTPGVQQLRTAVELVDERTREAVVAQVDDFREVAVRQGSHGMHPRSSRLGLRAALAAVAAHHGHPHARITVDASCLGEALGTPDTGRADVAGCLVRIVGLVLGGTDPQIGSTVNVHRTEAAWQVRMQDVANDPGSLPLVEVAARLREFDGRIEFPRAREVTVVVPTSRVVEESPVSADRVHLPMASAMTLVPITAVLVPLLGTSTAEVVAATIASVSIGAYSRLLLPAGPLRGAMLLRIIGVSIATAVTISGALLAAGMAWTGNSVLAAFTVANSVGIAVLLALFVAARALLGAWEDDVRAARESAQTARLESIDVANQVDDLRARVAGILHSRVQARLVVVAGRLSHQPLREADVEHARRALGVIAAVDVPDLRRVVMGDHDSADVATVVSQLAAVSGLAIECSAVLPAGARNSRSIADVVREAVGNAIVHGAATRVTVDVQAQAHGYRICVRDDGLGPPLAVAMGLGSALIDAATSGRWELTSGEHGGAHLVALVSR